MKTGRINHMKECNKEIGESLERIIKYIFEEARHLILSDNGDNYKGLVNVYYQTYAISNLKNLNRFKCKLFR